MLTTEEKIAHVTANRIRFVGHITLERCKRGIRNLFNQEVTDEQVLNTWKKQGLQIDDNVAS